MPQKRKIEVWSHRGIWTDSAENTMPAFVKAVEIGVDGIELDVQRSLDGELVVVHDEDLLRVAGKDIIINQANWSQLKAANVSMLRGGNERMPLLKEVLELLEPTGLTLNIELKNNVFDYPDLEANVINLTRSSKMEERILYSTFNTESVLRLTKLTDPSRCALLLAYPLTRPVWLSRNLGLSALNPHYKILKIPGYASLCHRNNIKLVTWTVNKKRDIAQMIRKKPQAIISDYPDLVISMLKAD